MILDNTIQNNAVHSKWCSWLMSEFMKSRYPWTYFSYGEVPLVCFFFFCNFNCALSQCHEWITRLKRYKWVILGWIPIAALVQIMKTKYFKPADILSMRFVTYDFVVLFVQATSFLHPGTGIPPLWLFLRFPPSFFSPVLKSSQVFHHSYWGSKNRGCRSLYSL